MPKHYLKKEPKLRKDPSLNYRRTILSLQERAQHPGVALHLSRISNVKLGFNSELISYFQLVEEHLLFGCRLECGNCEWLVTAMQYHGKKCAQTVVQ